MLLDSMAEQGFGSFASVGVDAISFGDLALRQIG
jgi:hypothetical protein